MILLVNCTNPDQMLRGVIVLLTDLQDISLPHNKVSKKNQSKQTPHYLNNYAVASAIKSGH